VSVVDPFGSDPYALGPKILDYIQRVLGIDREWSVRAERRLDWWPHTYRQTIVAESVIEHQGFIVTPFTCRTEILESMPESTRLYEALSQINQFASLASLTYDPDTKTVASTSRLYVHIGSTWLAQFLQAAAGVQLHQSEQLGPFWEQQLGGRFIRSAHPTSGLREKPDEITNVVESLLAPAGALDSPFQGLMDAVDSLPHPWSTLERSKDRLAAEIPFRDSVPLEERTAKGEPVTTAVLKVTTDETHPELGRGLAVMLVLPLPAKEGVDYMATNSLNLLEAGGAIALQAWKAGLANLMAPYLGSWLGQDVLQYRTFVPALLAQSRDAGWRTQMIHTFMLYATERARVTGASLQTSMFRRRAPSKHTLLGTSRATESPRGSRLLETYAQSLNDTIFGARSSFERTAPSGDHGEFMLELTGLVLNATNEATKAFRVDNELRQACLLKVMELFLIHVMGDPNGLNQAVIENKRWMYDLLLQHEHRWAQTWQDLVARGAVDDLKKQFDLYPWTDLPTPLVGTALEAYPTFMAIQFARSMEKPSRLEAPGGIQVLADLAARVLTEARPDRFAAELAAGDATQALIEARSPVGRFL